MVGVRSRAVLGDPTAVAALSRSRDGCCHMRTYGLVVGLRLIATLPGFCAVLPHCLNSSLLFLQFDAWSMS